MSELTRCNHCTLQAIKRRHPGQAVTTVWDDDGWLRVMVDDKPIGVLFMKLTTRCVC